ncbi:MAG: hypothetical protein JWO36_3614 [Myxococcales bacterium]|nr:hypothetical protein [Myxococcales bacterium]
MQVKGVDEKQITKFGDLGKLIVDGSLATLEAGGDPPPIVLGEKLAKRLGVKVGDRLSISLADPPRAVDPDGRAVPAALEVRVAATFLLGIDSYDSRFAYSTFRDMQHLQGRGDVASAVEIELTEADRAPDFARRLETQLGGMPYAARDWRELNRDNHVEKPAEPIREQTADEVPELDRLGAEAPGITRVWAKLCARGIWEGCTSLGMFYQNRAGLVANEEAERAGFLGAQKADPEHAASLYKRACDGGDLEGCAYLGLLYERAIGVAKDPAMAAALKTKACQGKLRYAKLDSLCQRR